MKILVTGANGYIGRHVVNALINKKHTVIASDISLDKTTNIVTKVKGNIFNDDTDLLAKLHRPDAVIHLAWRDGFNHNATSHIDDLPLHFNFLKKLIDCGIMQVCVMGTMHEVGYHEGIVNDTTPNNPISLYGIAKNTLRQSLLAYTQNKNTIIQWLRAFYICGDDYSNHSIFTKILEMSQNGQKSFPFTTGENKYDFIDIKSLAEQISEVISQQKTTGIINCCSGKPISLKNKVEEFISSHQLDIKPDYGKFPSRPYDSPIIYGDTTKITEIMGKHS